MNLINGFKEQFATIILNKNLYLYIVVLFIFIFANNYSLPIQVIPDEIAQLKNIYGMINAKSLALQYKTQFSIWVHYPYIPPTLLYWGSVYIFGDFSSIADFKFYVMNNYQEVLPFLRGFTATIFLIGLILVRRVIESVLNKEQSYIFFIFISLNLLIIINNHYSKFWMIDFGFMFISLYFYWKSKIVNSKYYAILAYFFFWIAVLSNPSIIMGGLYFIFLYYYFYKFDKKIFLDIFIFILVLLVMLVIQSNLGSHGHAEMIMDDPLQFLNPSIEVVYNLIFTQFDYDVITTILFFSSILYFLIKEKKLLWLLTPYLLNLILMASMFFETRYALFLVINSAFIATFSAYYIYKYKKKIFYFLAIIYLSINSYYIYSWLKLLTTKDTRLEAREWLNSNMTKQDFIIYNTLGFNYLPFTSESIKLLLEIAPQSIGTREEMHLKYKLRDGKNGVILWKLNLGYYDIVEFVKQLIKRGYRPILINERFGHQYGKNMYYQKTSNELDKLMDNFQSIEIKKFLPYKKDSKVDYEKIGDVLYNFNYVYLTMSNLKQIGPKLTIYELKLK